jgi:CubicO group peptidase (beta-lactamase class C family)
VSEFLPTANVSRGSTSPTVFGEGLTDLSDLKLPAEHGVEMPLEKVLASTYTDGFIVIKDRQVLFEEYFNGMDSHTRHLLMSVSKSVTGTLAGVVVGSGQLDPEERIVSYIPELKDSPGFVDATVRHILDMTTAIVFSEDYDDPESEVVAHEESCGWRGRNPRSEAGVYEFSRSIQRADRAHGELFHYASINTDVLAWLIERSTGQRLVDVLSDTIWSRLGADHDGHLTVDHKGSPVANGGFCLTLRDLARFGILMLNHGHIDRDEMVPHQWVEDTLSNGSNEAWLPTIYGPIWPKGRYRNQWYVTGDDHGSFFGIGVNGQHLWVNPTTQVVIAKFSSHPASVNKEAMFLSMSAMDTIARSQTAN